MLKIFTRDEHSHPLADAKELKLVFAGLVAGDPAKSLDELAGWMESVANADGVSPVQMFDIVRQLDDAAQPFVRHLTRDFLAPSQRTPSAEQKLWQLCVGYWDFTVQAYQAVIDGFLAAASDKAQSKLVEALRPDLPLLLSRHAAAVIARAKWRRFHHEPPLTGTWQALGQNFLLAEARKIDGEAVTLYPLSQIVTTPRREFIKAVALEASSLDSLLPVQIEVAEKLVAHFSPLFVLSRGNRPDNLYWIDASLDHAPQRLARLPVDTPGVRLLAFGEVPASLAAIIRVVERGDLPPELNLAGQYSPRLVLSVLRHLANYWAATPPLRKHQRHAVSSHLSVQHGFEACYSLVGGGAPPADDDALDFSVPGDAWQIDDVSLGGFGVSVSGGRREWLRAGALIAVKPEQGGGWMLGLVRRVQRQSESQYSVGLQTLARQVACVDLAVAGTPTRTGMSERALLIDQADGADGVRLVLPASTFDLRESYRAWLDGRQALLSPVELLESGSDYQIGRFRLRFAE